jgi:hypothetical protein
MCASGRGVNATGEGVDGSAEGATVGIPAEDWVIERILKRKGWIKEEKLRDVTSTRNM